MYSTHDFPPIMIFPFFKFHIDNLVLAAVELKITKQTKVR